MITDLSLPAGPGEIVDKLVQWARETPWVEWVELAGSLGRGAGDDKSDVDAGVGLTESARVEDVHDAISTFLPIASALRQSMGPDKTHLVMVYRDGRQLSLVVMPSAGRAGLPPQAVALVDKAHRLAPAIESSKWDPNPEQRREWTFLACIGVSDALKHAARGNVWRALISLQEARDLYLQLLAASERVTFPQFGAVSLENTNEPLPLNLELTLVSRPSQSTIAAAVAVLVSLLAPFIQENNLKDLIDALGLTSS